MGYMGKDDQMISLAMSYEEVQMNASWVHSQTLEYLCVYKQMKTGEHLIMKYISNTRWTQVLAPLEILMSKISLKYIPIHIHHFEHGRVIMNMKLSSHGFLLHRNINKRKQSPNSLNHHHNEKNQRIYFWCAAKDNWASQMSEMALWKELEQWNFQFPPSGQSLIISNQHKMEDVSISS